MSFKNTVEKGEIASIAISPFPTVFSTCYGELSANFIKFENVSANYFRFEESKICRLGKG